MWRPSIESKFVQSDYIEVTEEIINGNTSNGFFYSSRATTEAIELSFVADNKKRFHITNECPSKLYSFHINRNSFLF